MHKLTKQKLIYYFWTTGFPIILAVFFVLYKISILHKGLYKSDVYSFYQSATDWLIDKPLYFENVFGSLFQHHTYYLIPALAPFTFLFGIEGLFIVHIIFILLAIRSWILTVDSYYRPTRSIGLCILIFGPLGFYLWDNITYGWHIETLAFPLTLYAGALLYRKKNISASVILLLICLLKEDGVVQAAAIISMYILLQAFTYVISRKKAFYLILMVYGIAFLLFLLNIFILKISKADARLSQSFSGFELFLNDGWNALNYLWTLTKYYLVFVLSIPFFLLVFHPIKKRFYFLYIFIIPSLITAFVGGMFYYPQESFSILWSPRLSFSSSLVILATLFILNEFKLKMVHAKLRLSLLLFLHLYVFYMPSFNRYYNPLFFSRIALGKEISKEHTEMLVELKAISECLTERETLVVDEFLAFEFEKHDFILNDAFISSYLHSPSLAVLRINTRLDTERFFVPSDSVSFNQLKVYFAQKNHPFAQKISTQATSLSKQP